MKKIYICADSFGCYDADYPGLSWHEKLEKKLSPQFKIINFSKVFASNLMISLQVDKAIIEQADFIIVMGTSLLRDEVKITDIESKLPLVDRFVDITSNNNLDTQNLVSYTMLNINQDFLSKVNDTLIAYKKLKDLNLLIYKDQCIIENTLQKLVDSDIPFVFDQGGFENPQYGAIKNCYFEKFKKYQSKKNMWNYTTNRSFRPYYHLIDDNITDEFSQYYYSLIVNTL